MFMPNIVGTTTIQRELVSNDKTWSSVVNASDEAFMILNLENFWNTMIKEDISDDY